MAEEYCIYTRDFDQAQGFITALSNMGISIEPHANRTRFWLDSNQKEHYLFYLRYSHVLHRVKEVTASTITAIHENTVKFKG